MLSVHLNEFELVIYLLVRLVQMTRVQNNTTLSASLRDMDIPINSSIS